MAGTVETSWLQARGGAVSRRQGFYFYRNDRLIQAGGVELCGGLRVGEAWPTRIDAALGSMRSAHGSTMARQSKSILRGDLQLAVMAGVLGANPVRDVQPLRSKSQPTGAVALLANRMRDLLVNLRPTGTTLPVVA